MASQPRDFRNDEKTDFICPCIFLTASVVWNKMLTPHGNLCCTYCPHPVPSSLCSQHASLFCYSFSKTQNAFPSQGGCPRCSLCLALPGILYSGLRSWSKSHLLKTMKQNQKVRCWHEERHTGQWNKLRVAPALCHTRKRIWDGSWSKGESPNSKASGRKDKNELHDPG